MKQDEKRSIEQPSSTRQPYTRPTLKYLGTVAELTEGGAIGCVADTLGLVKHSGD